MVRIPRKDNPRMLQLQLSSEFRECTIMICLVFPRAASATPSCSNFVPTAFRLTSTLSKSVFVHFFVPPYFLFPLRTTLRVYSTLPRFCGKDMLGGRFAELGKRKTKGRLCFCPAAKGAAGCVQGCTVKSCLRIFPSAKHS